MDWREKVEERNKMRVQERKPKSEKSELQTGKQRIGVFLIIVSS
jgi:hypothetical protein